MARRGAHAARTRISAMARSRGTVAGPLLIALGAWGAIIPFVGHYFGYGYSPNTTWQWTAARGWLEVLPGCVTILAGSVITVTANRFMALLAGWLGVAAGAWYVIGVSVSSVLNVGFIGVPAGGSGQALTEAIGMFLGLGAVIIALSGMAVGRAAVVSLRDIAAINDDPVFVATAPTASDNDANVYPPSSPLAGLTPAHQAPSDERADIPNRRLF